MSGLAILSQFVLRLSFGLALGLWLAPAGRVTSGHFRNHLYVLLGLTVLASLVATADPARYWLWPSLTCAVLSYVGSVVWLYEKPLAGKMFIAAITVVALIGACQAKTAASPTSSETTVVTRVANVLDPLTSGASVGLTIAAMFLGHWYLNTPTMEIAPLRRLLLAMTVAIAARGIVCAGGLILWIMANGAPPPIQISLLTLHWLAGIFGALLLTWMSWQTLKIPNTQSATGILYVAVIATFLGELTSQLLTVRSPFPL